MVDPLGFDVSDYLIFDFKAYMSCSSAVTRVRIRLGHHLLLAQDVGFFLRTGRRLPDASAASAARTKQLLSGSKSH